MNKRNYVILTAAHNEERYIEATIKSVVEQTIPPLRWVIVSDGSTDGTDRIVRRYAREHQWITLKRVEKDGSRHFGSKARAINGAYKEFMTNLDHRYVANLDADITFEPDYYEQTISRFEAFPQLGLTGGVLMERIGNRYVRQVTSTNWSVSGPIQMFRRQCFEAIGGYRPVSKSLDGIAEVTTRMQGWSVRAFPDITVVHHRRTGSQNTGALKASFSSGVGYYRVGFNPLFHFAKSVWRMADRPYVIGGILMFAGYVYAWASRQKREVSPEFQRFQSKEQLGRLMSLLPLREKGEPSHARE